MKAQAAFKTVLVLLLVFGTIALFASPDAPLSVLDRETFTGAGIVVVVLVWVVVLRLVFGGKKFEPEKPDQR